MSSTDSTGAGRHRQSVRCAWHRPRSAQHRVAYALGVGFARFATGAACAGRSRHASVGPGAGRCVRPRRARAGCRRRRSRPGVDRPRVLRSRHARCSRRDVHRVAQPGAVQRRQVLPQRRPRRRAGHRVWPRSSRSRPTCSPATARASSRAAGSPTSRNLLSAFADHVVSFIDPAIDASAARRRRHGQRHGRPRRAGGVRAPAADHAWK